jgi:Ca2+-binding RTX toxin-like protein
VPRTPYSTLRRWFAAKPSPTRTFRRSKLNLVGLEDRSVPAVTAVFAGGTLTVTGDAADNVLDIVLVGGQVRVKEIVGANSNDITIAGGPVTPTNLVQIVAHGNLGNDTISVSNLIKRPAQLFGDTGSDNLTGGGGNDIITTSDAADPVGDTANGQDGNDTVTGGPGPDLLSGGKGNDQITGGDGVNFLAGGDGNDNLTGGPDIDDISGGSGNDSINGVNGNDRLRGDDATGKLPGNDTVNGGLGDDVISGGGKNDVLQGGSGSDKIEGGSGNDNIIAGPDVAIPLDADADSVFGGIGNDTMVGGAGDDVLYGEAGMDSITGGAGSDLLSGGLNRDFFVGHGPGAPGAATDAANFDTYQDEFDLTRPVFGKASPGDVAVTELGIQDALAGFASVSNKPGDFNIAGRIRYLGSGEYLVKLGPPGDIDEDPSNPNPFGYVQVHFNGTWTDNEPRPSAGERFLAPTVITEQREFWTILYHRAVAQSLVPGYDPFLWTAAVDPAMTNTGSVVEAMTGRPADVFVLSSSPPPGFTFTDIQNNLAAPFWLSAKTKAVPTPGLVGNQAYAITRAFTLNGANFITLYNPSGRDRGVNSGSPFDAVGIPKDDGFITISETDFFNNFVVGYKN